jgi:hypothetical protein
MLTRRIQVTTGLVVALVGLVALLEALNDLDLLSSSGGPGPGLFPALLSGSLCVLGLALAAVHLRPARTPQEIEQTNAPPCVSLRAGLLWGCFAISIALVPLLGFVLSGLVLIALIVLFVEQIRTVPAVIGLCTLPIGAYLLFGVLLEVRLPEGVLWS